MEHSPLPHYAKAAAALCILTLAACGGEDAAERQRVNAPVQPDDGLSVNRLLSGELFQNQGPALNVNAFLWRASLDTLDFLPIASTDPFGGVIATDWGAPSSLVGERYRAVVVIQSDELSVDSLRLGLFRQVRDEAAWVDAPVAEQTTRQLEDAILLRARQLRRDDALNR